MKKTQLDNKDLHILELLLENARISHRQICQSTGIPTMTVQHRIKKMEKLGVIKHYTTKINHELLGLGVAAYVLLDTNYSYVQKTNTSQVEIAEKLAKHPFISNINTIAGKKDILLKIRARNVKELNTHITTLSKIKGIQNTETLVVLHDVEDSNHKEIIKMIGDK